MAYCSSIDRALDKDGVVYNKITSLQFSVGNKAWATTGDVHVGFWLPERAAQRVWLEGVNNVPTSCLVDELKGDLVCEWPLKDVVKLSSHHHKEQ